MFILTDSMRGLLGELASAGHAMEITLDADKLHVTVDYGSPRKVKNASASRPAPKEPAKPRFGRKPGRKAKAEYKVVDGRRFRLYAFNGESLTIYEWAKRYGCGAKTMASRFRSSGTPETTRNKSKSDRTSLKARLGGAK